MKLCKNCQQIPEQYEVDLCQENLPESINNLMEEYGIRTMMQTKEHITCSHCGSVYDLDIFTEVFRVGFSLRRLATTESVN